MLEVAGVLTSVRNNVFEWKIFEVFQEIGEDVSDYDIQVCRITKIKQYSNLPTEKIIFKF